MKKITIEIEADDDAEADKLLAFVVACIEEKIVFGTRVRLLDGDKHIGSIRVEHIKA